MAPLSRQTDFFVPEMKEEVKTDLKEEDSDEDRGTDITGEISGWTSGLFNRTPALKMAESVVFASTVVRNEKLHKLHMVPQEFLLPLCPELWDPAAAVANKRCKGELCVDVAGPGRAPLGALNE